MKRRLKTKKVRYITKGKRKTIKINETKVKQKRKKIEDIK